MMSAEAEEHAEQDGSPSSLNGLKVAISMHRHTHRSLSTSRKRRVADILEEKNNRTL